MFAKGPRFPPDKPSEVPGPGYYKLPEECRHDAYKKGAFLERTDRFSAEGRNDTVGDLGGRNDAPRESKSQERPSHPLPPTQGLTHLQQELETLKSQNARLEKEHHQAIRKYNEKLTHNEGTIKSLVKDNVSLQSKVSTQQKEYRAICQRETALKAALENLESAAKSQSEQAHKFAALQRKLDDLEKLHVVNKKKHQSETDGLRAELDASRKAFTGQAERSTVLRKQLEISEARTNDLKKAVIGDQGEIKELRKKLQDAEEANRSTIFHQADLDQAKKSLHSLETRYKAELHDRAAKFSQQEKSLMAEKQRREALERRIQEAESQADVQLKEMKDRNRTTEAEMDGMKRLAEEANLAAQDAIKQSCDLRNTIARVAEAYGNLSASSVPRQVYRQLQLDYASLQLWGIRLERRISDRETLTQQLTELCRQLTEEKLLLAHMLREAEEDRDTSLHCYQSSEDESPTKDISLMHTALLAFEETYRIKDAVKQSDLQSAKAIASLVLAEFQDLLVAYAVAHHQSIEQGAAATRFLDAYVKHQTEGEALRANYRNAEKTLSLQKAEIDEGVARLQVLEEGLTEHKREITKLEEALRKEREAHASVIHSGHLRKRNEDALHLEVDILVEELQDAMRYKEAHSDLLAEVVELIQRNELAEAEADRLNKFNSEILGHKNPQQRIYYVDRIRRELADTKQQLLKSTRNNENLVADNVALQHEVASYKSIEMPFDSRPRVRVERLPLFPRSANGLTANIASDLTPSEEDRKLCQ